MSSNNKTKKIVKMILLNSLAVWFKWDQRSDCLWNMATDYKSVNKTQPLEAWTVIL